MTATRARPSTSLSIVKARPIIGATRSTEKKSAVTICERRISGSAGPSRFRLIETSLIAASPVKTSCCARQSR